MKIAVLISTYNGEEYIEEQIDSLLKQDIDIDIYIRDDGSIDKTVDILKKYEKKNNIFVEYGENLGYQKSFMELLLKTKGYDYYSFCDQDDVWLSSKISSAINMIRKYENLPSIYYSNLKKCDKHLNIYGITKLQNRVMSLQSNILRRSIAGCTMVINRKFWEIISAIGIQEELLVQGHDSYLVSLCYAIGGKIICDENSYILYRQHGNNTSGSSNGLIYRIKKELISVIKNRENEYMIAVALIKYGNGYLRYHYIKQLEEFIQYKNSLKKRVKIVIDESYKTGNIFLTIMGKLKILFGIL